MSMIATMMESVATIRRPRVGRDSVSGVTSTPFTTLLSNIPCCLSRSGPTVQAIYAQRNVIVNATIYFAQDPQTEVNDIIDVTDRTGVVQRYLVEGESPTVTGRARAWSVVCRRIQAPGT